MTTSAPRWTLEGVRFLFLLFVSLISLVPAKVGAETPDLGAPNNQASCRSVNVLFKPTANLQIAVWVEDSLGNYVDTVYVTRLTGSLGLGNRPGKARFKTDFRFPYGRRDMVLPVWAHKRNHQYGKLMMGGMAGASISECFDNGIAGSDCDDDTIGYHFMVSSPEPFFCSPRGGVTIKQNSIDVVSCASSFYGSKGAYALSGSSLYPPRADLTSFVADHDSNAAHLFAMVNDLGAVSGATPPGNQLLASSLHWTPPTYVADGNYVMKVEAHLEADFNTFHHYPNLDDEHQELNGYGHDFLGQPSVVYAVPFTLGTTADEQRTSAFEGYSDWDGATGAVHPADTTISTDDGTGAGRLQMAQVGGSSFRVQVTTEPTCGDGGVRPVCEAPASVESLLLQPGPTSITLKFNSAATGTPTAGFDIRYREGVTITDADFLSAIPSSDSSPVAGAPGSPVSSVITGLRPEIKYFVAVRARSACEAPSAIVVKPTTTSSASFVTLSGCFIATAAYGTPMATQIDGLRRLRDRYLLTNPAGRLLVASYYALSPPIARALSTNDLLRRGVRSILQPLVDATR